MELLATGLRSMSKPTNLPPQEHAWDGACLALRNADYHRSCAEILAEHEKFGAAVSHLVLATEEAIKSLSHLSAAIGLPLPQADARRLLTNHRARHVMAALAYALNDFISRSLVSSEIPAAGNSPSVDAVFAGVEQLLVRWSDYLADMRGSEIERDVAWWETANSLKQIGMYVDYSASGWNTPLEIDRAAYETSAAVVARFFDSFDGPMRPWIDADSAIRESLVRWFAPLATKIEGDYSERLGNLLTAADPPER